MGFLKGHESIAWRVIGFRWRTPHHFGGLNKREITSREILHSTEMGTGERIFDILMA